MGDEWTASPKKIEELKTLTSLFSELVEKEKFTVKHSWRPGIPKDASLELVDDNGCVTLQCYVNEAGKNYDRVGKITFELEWCHFGIYDEEKDEQIGEFEQFKNCTLKRALDLVPKAIHEAKFGRK